MKKQFIFHFGFVLLSFLSINILFAQEGRLKELSPTVTSSAVTHINERVSASFLKYFKGAKDVHWYEQDRKYFAKFNLDGHEHLAMINRKGIITYHNTYGAVNSLPAEVLQLVKYSYADYKVTNAIKVQQGNRTIWVLNLEDDLNFILARSENGELEVVDQFRKAPVNLITGAK